MKQGKLLAKDILPLLGKEFSAMARTGGALDVALNSLNTTSQRMSTSFRELVNRIYQGGLAEALSSLYKALDKMFYFSDGSGFGKVFLGFFKELENTMWNIWDIGQILGYYFRHSFGTDVDGEFLGKMVYWTALFGILGKISGLFKIILGNKNLSGFKGLVAGVGKVGLFATAAALGSTGGDSAVDLGGDMALMVGSMFGPWGLAIGAFVKAGTLVYENWDTITKWWVELDMKSLFLNFTRKIRDLFGLEDQKTPLQNIWDTTQSQAAFASGMSLTTAPNVKTWADYERDRQIQELINNQKPQKVEIVVDKAQGLENYVELKINEREQRKIAEILTTSFGTPPKL